MPQISSDETLALANRIRQDIQDATVKTDTDEIVPFTVSIGIAHLQTGKDSSIEQIISRADKALYAAKANNKNQVVEQN